VLRSAVEVLDTLPRHAKAWFDLPPVADPNAPRASFLRVFAAVFSSFLGIRKKAAGERDAVSIKPLHVILAGLLGAAILVAALFTLVRFITHPG
jgi:hypothetical protein